MPIAKLSKKTLVDYSEQFMCLKAEDRIIKGEYDSEIGQSLVVELQKCTADQEVQCKSDAEIQNFFNQGGNLLLLNNQIRFDSYQYGADSIIKESKITWLPISNIVKQ